MGDVWGPIRPGARQSGISNLLRLAPMGPLGEAAGDRPAAGPRRKGPGALGLRPFGTRLSSRRLLCQPVDGRSDAFRGWRSLLHLSCCCCRRRRRALLLHHCDSSNSLLISLCGFHLCGRRRFAGFLRGCRCSRYLRTGGAGNGTYSAHGEPPLELPRPAQSLSAQEVGSLSPDPPRQDRFVTDEPFAEVRRRVVGWGGVGRWWGRAGPPVPPPPGFLAGVAGPESSQSASHSPLAPSPPGRGPGSRRRNRRAVRPVSRSPFSPSPSRHTEGETLATVEGFPMVSAMT
jgi:hypothetical protein